MSPDTLQYQMNQFVEGNGSLEKKSDNDGIPEIRTDSCDPHQGDTSPFIRTETKRLCNEDIEVVRSGLTLSQAEVEAAMKKVSYYAVVLMTRCLSFHATGLSKGNLSKSL